MGLFGAYLAYRHGKKKAERRAQRERDEARFDADDDIVCDNCGHRLSQHSDDDPPMCPHY